ncbi:hypothetical protein, partial [Klebsiella pneumoniae]|uniref:hypothetical protein n=1 Tax=Klebsiella pneumoniae TaxID=573 RepID=UPI001179E8EE
MKPHITNLSKFLTQCDTGVIDEIKLSLRVETVKSIFEGFNDVQDEIELLEEEQKIDSGKGIDERFIIQEDYISVMAAAKRLFKHAQQHEINYDNENTDANSTGSNHEIRQKRKIKLP